MLPSSNFKSHALTPGGVHTKDGIHYRLIRLQSYRYTVPITPLLSIEPKVSEGNLDSMLSLTYVILVIM